MKGIGLEINDFDLDEIESIELIGEDYTVDITVEDTHMFFANDIYTHNSSIKSEIVESDQIGGSIKKGQIGHFIMSIAKSLEQKENGRANVAILKSRFGKDGITFMDVLFDNKTIQIDISDTASALTFTQKKQVDVKNEQDYVNQVLSKARQRINDIDDI
jgi:phosphodiesterase/alkaline phosphatase D-like protein